MFDKAIDKAFTAYTPTEQDVFICSYFKSGTNWMMQVAHQIANRGEGEFDDILDVVPWPDCPAPDTTISLADPRPAQLSKTGLRAIKTHARAEYVPYSERAKYICVVRDPKDVVVSGHNFFGSMLLGSLMPSIGPGLNTVVRRKQYLVTGRTLPIVTGSGANALMYCSLPMKTCRTTLLQPLAGSLN